MLAFIHIEKAAGQTFIRILENNFVYRHCRVAPLKKEHKGVFQWADLQLLMKINPFLNALAGHSVVPYSDLSEYKSDIRYITILRDPVKRYISHYQYWVQVLNKQISFEKFLSIEDLNNFQTKKIAGSADVSSAKKTVKEKIFLAGVVEEFDDFLVILKNKMAPGSFDIRYKRRNVAKGNLIKKNIFERFDKYKENILSNNQLDQELYHYVKETSFQKEKAQWLKKDDCQIVNDQPNLATKLNREIIGRIYRNLYIGPVTNIIRKLNGLKPGGSY